MRDDVRIDMIPKRGEIPNAAGGVTFIGWRLTMAYSKIIYGATC